MSIITTVDEFLGRMYLVEVVERKIVDKDLVRELTANLSTADLRARLASLANVAPQRCFASKQYREFIQRALALR